MKRNDKLVEILEITNQAFDSMVLINDDIEKYCGKKAFNELDKALEGLETLRNIIASKIK